MESCPECGISILHLVLYMVKRRLVQIPSGRFQYFFLLIIRL